MRLSCRNTKRPAVIHINNLNVYERILSSELYDGAETCSAYTRLAPPLATSSTVTRPFSLLAVQTFIFFFFFRWVLLHVFPLTLLLFKVISRHSPEGQPHHLLMLYIVFSRAGRKDLIQPDPSHLHGLPFTSSRRRAWGNLVFYNSGFSPFLSYVHV